MVAKLRSIQLLRGLAACAVVVLHAVPEGEQAIGGRGFGAAGVDLFFVISGFIMTNVARDRKALEFLRDRLWRIYPMWWIAVLPWIFMVPRGPTAIVSSLTLWPIYAGGYYVPVLKVGWTLSFELLFYLGMTFAILRGAALPLLAYGLFLVAALASSSPLMHFVGSPMTLEFLMGVAIAGLPRRALLGFLVPAGIALFALTSPAIGDVDSTLHPQWALWRALLWGCPAALVVWGALSLEPLFARQLFDLPVAVGDASYSIYLFHPLVAFGLALPWIVRLVLGIAIGCAMHLLVERRLMKIRPYSKAKLIPAAA